MRWVTNVLASRESPIVPGQTPSFHRAIFPISGDGAAEDLIKSCKTASGTGLGAVTIMLSVERIGLDPTGISEGCALAANAKAHQNTTTVGRIRYGMSPPN